MAMESIIDRIRQIIKYQGISERSFCKEVGFSNGFLGKVNDIGSQKVRDIVVRYPHVSLEWLLLGEGSMLKSEGKNADTACALCAEKDRTIAALTDQIEAKDEIIRLLKGGGKTQRSALYSDDVSDAVAG